MKYIILLSLLIEFTVAQNSQIFVDENFDDWNSIATFVEDSQENLGSGVDYKKLWITNNDSLLFIRIDLYEDALFQEDTSTVLLIDTDNNSGTGFSDYGIGAELKYYFGKRLGYFYSNQDSIQLNHADLDIVSAPTVTSDKFEIVLNLNSIVQSNTIFSSQTINVKFVNFINGLDVIPDNNSLTYDIVSSGSYTYKDYNINKDTNSLFRLMSYNIHRDDIFLQERFVSYKRIFNSVNPDIIAFQEIYDHTSEEVKDLVENFLPSGQGETWYHAKIEPIDQSIYNKVDLILVSRFPIKESYRIQGYVYPQFGISQSNSAYTIDLPNTCKDLLLVNVHTPCCQNNINREVELDEVMSFIKDAKSAGGDIDIAENTPIIITGDMNLVGPSRQRDILTHGNFVDNNKYGDDFNPDWDETPFADVKPYTTDVPNVFTWYNEAESFQPGRLDYMVYSDYSLSVNNSFVLFTNRMSDDKLNQYGLEKSDVTIASDHLPLIADFSLTSTVNTNETNELPNELKLFQNYPNPFNPETKIKFWVNKTSNIKLNIYNSLGQKIETLLNKEFSIGRYNVIFNAEKYSSGVYYYQLISDDKVITKKLVLLK